MEITTARLSDVLPNPYRNLNDYPIDQAKCEQLAHSINETGFWLGIRARRNNAGQLEIAFGHHRIAAAKFALGENHEAQFEVGEFSDLEMLRMMAHENADVYARSLGHAMLCVTQAREALQTIVARVPVAVFSAACESRATSREGLRDARRAAERAVTEPAFTPHRGDLTILCELFGADRQTATAAYSQGVGRETIVKYLDKAITAAAVRGCLEVLAAQDELQVTNLAQTIANNNDNPTSAVHMTRAIRNAVRRGDMTPDEVTQVAETANRRVRQGHANGNRNAGRPRTVVRATNEVIGERAAARGDDAAVLNAQRAEVIASLERLPGDIRSGANALGRFVKQCRHAEVSTITDVRGRFGGLYSAVALSLSNASALLTTVGVQCDRESGERMLTAARKIVDALESANSRPRLRAVGSE
jgi:hypothetical protein